MNANWMTRARSWATAAITATVAITLPATAVANTGDGAPPEGVVSQISETETSYTGARILKAGTEIFGGDVAPGVYMDDNHENEDLDLSLIHI